MLSGGDHVRDVTCPSLSPDPAMDLHASLSVSAEVAARPRRGRRRTTWGKPSSGRSARLGEGDCRLAGPEAMSTTPSSLAAEAWRWAARGTGGRRRGTLATGREEAWDGRGALAAVYELHFFRGVES